MADQHLLEVGKVHKPHGLRGEVVVSLTTNMVSERTTPGVELYLDDDRYVIETARAHQDRWLIRFKGVASREDADRLRGRLVRAAPLESDDHVFVHELVGRALVDQHGRQHGDIVAVVDNPAADLLELADGRLVPLNFYVRHDDDQVHVDVPVGLLDDEQSISAR